LLSRTPNLLRLEPSAQRALEREADDVPQGIRLR